MPIPEVPQSIQKVTRRQNAIHISMMELSERRDSEIEVKSTYDQKVNLRALMVEMHRKKIGVDQLLTEQHRTIVENTEGRIDSQTPGRANIQYQVRNDTHAMTQIHVMPTETENCPDLAGRWIDDKDFGFGTDQILAFLQDGLEYSAHGKVYTDITWKIMRIQVVDPKLQPKYYFPRIEEFLGASAFKLTAKAVAKGGMIKALSKMGGQTVVKKVPVLGLICGSIFAMWRMGAGDYEGAVMEIASGIASTIPGAGTAASIGIDAMLLVRDFDK